MLRLKRNLLSMALASATVLIATALSIGTVWVWLSILP